MKNIIKESGITITFGILLYAIHLLNVLENIPINTNYCIFGLIIIYLIIQLLLYRSKDAQYYLHSAYWLKSILIPYFVYTWFLVLMSLGFIPIVVPVFGLVLSGYLLLLTAVVTWLVIALTSINMILYTIKNGDSFIKKLVIIVSQFIPVLDVITVFCFAVYHKEIRKFIIGFIIGLLCLILF